MRNPALHLVGIAASPGGGGVFGTRAEEELRQWLEQRLDALGIDPVAYSRFVLSLLRRPDSALTPPLDVANTGRNGGGGRRSRARPRTKLPLQGDREQRRAVVQCLTSAADQKCGVEPLVDELCAKLKDLEGGDSKDEQEQLKTATDGEAKVPFETLTPRDRALRYYAAFPALQPTTPKKFPHRKERNLSNNNNNNNNNNNCNNNNNKKNNGISNYGNNNNNNNKTRQKKNKISIQATDLQLTDEKEDFGFAKSMEREREKEQELALDQLRLAQLQAKFDESLEALWDTGPGNSQGTDSIWAAPSLSIPSGPAWPTDTADASFPMITLEKSTAETPLGDDAYIDDSPLIPWDVDLFSIEDYAEESGSKEKTQDNTSWSDSAGDGPWCWGGLGNIAALGRSPSTGSCFFPVVPCKSPVTIGKESCLQQKVSSVTEPDEDLLTSARTHFRPIKEDGHWADGTTFPVNNTLERVTYRRSESGNLLYLPGGESPYMEYRESMNTSVGAVPSNLTLKFRVRQCDKSIQTEPIRSPVKRRILSEQDRLYYSPNAAEEASVIDNEEVEKDSFDLEQVGWDQSAMLLRNERKRRHSSSFKSRPLTVLRPLTL